MISLVTDSTCDITPATAQQLGIHLIPLHVQLAGKSYLDWQNIDPESVYHHQREGGKVTTAPVTQQVFEATYSELLKTHQQIISIHISSYLSDTVQHARRAAMALGASNRILVVDSGLATTCLADAVLAANQAIGQGGDMEAAQKAVQYVRQEGLAEFTVPTLEYLRRGGRLSRTQELMGNMLGMRPVLRFDSGRLAAVRRVQSQHALRDIVVKFESHFGDQPISVAVAHAGRDEQRIQELREAIGNSKLNVVQRRSQLIGSVIGAHVGPGTFGISAYPVSP